MPKTTPRPMDATFNLCQQAFTLSLMANSISNQQGTPPTLASALSTALSNFFSQQNTINCIGQWSVVWGPAIFESSPGPSSYADNAMYVAANSDNSVYVVAIAGTNPNSTYDWQQEDQNVGSTTTWANAFPSLQPYGVPPSQPTLNPYLSAGTQLGVNNLLSMVDTVITQQSLVGFLGSLGSTSGSTLIFTGHSLGGALSPTLAMALFNPNGGKLSLGNWGNVFVFPTAGATPGNADFATMFNQVFPPTAMAGGSEPYWAWNQDIWNSLDVVPHAWVISMLEQIPTLYPASWSQIPWQLTLGVNDAINASNNGANTGAGPYTRLANVEVDGTFNTSIPVSDFNSFKEQAAYQHTTDYEVLLDIQSVLPSGFSQSRLAQAARGLLTTRQDEAKGRKAG